MMIKSFASLLRQIIVILQPKIQDDEAGGMIESWQEFKTVSAQAQNLYEQRNNHGEIFTSMQLIDNSFYRFRIRYLPGLKTNMRINYDGRNFQIKRIINQDERNAISVIITQENL